MESVVILMSTYNGSKFIKEQIDSILHQDYIGNVTILIRDDASKDDTLKIISNYDLTDIENREIVVITGENLGPQKSFLKLLEEAPIADYYFFADQDDVWKDNKISTAMEHLKNLNGKYKLYCSDYSLVDENLNPIKENNVQIDEKTFHPLRMLFYNEFPGCTMAFNYSLLNLINKMRVEDCMMHDSLIGYVCAAVGEIYYDNEPSILHRIHGLNVVGTGHKKIHLFKWIKEKTHLLFHKETYDLSSISTKLLEVSENEIKEKYKNDIILLANYKKKHKYKRRLLKHPDTKNKMNRTTLSIRCKIFFKLF